MATVQAQMLSGRFRTESLCSHWSTKNKDGICLLSPLCSSEVEDLHHILYYCAALEPSREKLRKYSIEQCKEYPVIANLIDKLLIDSNPDVFCQFLLNCSTIPVVISAIQLHGNGVLHQLFHVSRMWVYCLHRERMKILGRWNPI